MKSGKLKKNVLKNIALIIILMDCSNALNGMFKNQNIVNLIHLIRPY